MFLVFGLCYFSHFYPLIWTKRDRGQSLANLVMRTDEQLSLRWPLEGKELHVHCRRSSAGVAKEYGGVPARVISWSLGALGTCFEA